MSNDLWPSGMTEYRQQTLSAVLWLTYLHGPFEDEGGHATKLLLDHLAEAGYGLSPAWIAKGMDDLSGKTKRMKALIGRDISAKRTYKIWYKADPSDLPPWPFEGKPRYRPEHRSLPAAKEPPAEDDPIDTTPDQGDEEVPDSAGDVLDPVEVDPVDEVKEEEVDDVGLPRLQTTEIELHPHLGEHHQPDETEMLAYAISALQEVQSRLNVRAAHDFERFLAGRVDLVDQLTQENAKLRHQLVEEKQSYAELKRAYLRVTGGGRLPAH